MLQAYRIDTQRHTTEVKYLRLRCRVEAEASVRLNAVDEFQLRFCLLSGFEV